MCAPSAPDPPDYVGAAQAESYGSTQSAIATNLMSHPDTYTPLGSQTWEQTGVASVPSVHGQPGFSFPTYSQNITLSPEQQYLYDMQTSLSGGLLELGQNSLNQVSQSLASPFDLSSVQDIADQSYEMQTSRLDPRWQANRERQENQLYNQGLSPGTEAWDNAMRSFGESENDAYNQARLSSISTMPQTYQLEAANRMQPLTEFNAIRTGTQPQMPQFQPVQYAGTQGPQYMNAAVGQGNFSIDAYGQQVGGYNNMMSGLASLGSAAIIASDRRLKRDIEKLYEDDRGFGIYKFKYLWSPLEFIGVMADEIEKIIPEAVMTINGYKAVNYALL